MKNYLYLLAFPLLLAACSESVPIEDETDENNNVKEELRIGAGISSSVALRDGVVTRADGVTTTFTKDFDLYLTQTAPLDPSYLTNGKYNAAFNTSNYKVVSTSDETVYWDNIGGVSAALSLQGMYPKSDNAISSSPFSWSVKANQSTESYYEMSDLLISNRITDYKLSDQKSTVATLEFQHVLSKLTFVLKGGEGYTTDDFIPDITITSLETAGQVTVDAADGTVSVVPSGDAVDVIPRPVSGSGTLTQTFEAIIIPGQTIDTTSPLATIVVTIKGGENNYLVTLPEAVALEAGKNYQFDITVNKTGTTVAATVKDWVTGEPIAETVNINVSDNNLVNGESLVESASLYMELDDIKRKFTYAKKSTPTWSTDQVIYWDDVNWRADLYSDAVLYNKADDDINENPEHIYTGKSAVLDKAYTLIPYADLIHPFSKFIITLRTPTNDANKVDLTKLNKVSFATNLKKFVSINIDLSSSDPYRLITYDTATTAISISSYNLTESDNQQSYTLPPIYMNPCSVPVGELLRLYYEDGDLKNEYPLSIQSETKFAANNTYTITVTLYKTEIADIAVSINEWGSGTQIDGEAGIDK